MGHSSSEEGPLRRYEEAIRRYCDPSQREHTELALRPGMELNETQRDSLVRDVIRDSEKVLRDDERTDTLRRDWDPSNWVFSLIPQVHTGGRRGMGGRPSGSTIDVRRHFKSLLCSVLSSSLIELDLKSDVRLNEFLDEDAIAKLSEIHSQGLTTLYKNNFGLLPGNMLGVYAKFTYRDTPTVNHEVENNNIANSRDRHLLCTWLDRKGNVRCSCIGKTLFAAKSNVNQFSNPCCAHATHMYDFFESLIPDTANNRTVQSRNVMSSISQAVKGARSAPTLFEGQRGTSLFLPYKDYAEFGSCGEQWIPIRVSAKRSSVLTCAFCDMRSESNCEHIKEWKRCKDIGFYEESLEVSEQCSGRESRYIDRNNDTTEVLDEEYPEEKLGRSYLPIAPINCPKSVQLDRSLGDLVRPGSDSETSTTVFLVPAPQRCPKCSAERDEMSRKEMGEGIISCTMGPVRMRVESFRCSSSDCSALIYEEGRNHQMVFYSFSSAATHAFMRREIQAVVLSGGTINNRFTNYLRNRLEDRSSGLIPKQAILRGIKTLTKLFSLTVKLMVIETSPMLFKCDTCEHSEGNPISAVCVDGIWAGYDRCSSQPLIHISEECNPIPTGRATSHRARPNSALFRSDAVANILSNVIKGQKKDVVSEKNFFSALSALRVVDPTLVPESWNVQSIFSHVRGASEMSELLSAFREVTYTLFKRNIVVTRLANFIGPLLQKKIQRISRTCDGSRRRRLKRNGTYQMTDKDILSEPVVVSKIVSYGQQETNRVPLQMLVGENGICWSDEVFAMSADSRRTLFNFYMIILHGPITQFVLAPETDSLRKVATWFSHMGSTSYIRARLLEMHEDGSINIIKSNKFLMGSLLAILELQECANHKPGKVLQAFGQILHAMANVVESFYHAYGRFDYAEASALVYRKRWGKASRRLFRKHLMKHPQLKRQFRGFDDLFKSGIFFPNHPQVRPMPFNDRVDFRNRHGDYGSCSKHYDSLRPDFTPGAITFCCACSHPIIFGFKVLERGEGPRAVLDVLISRFSSLPRFVIYDFACGLLRSAQHTLWWAVENTTLVSDRFHIDNHTCHRGFHPDSYNYLNGRNTVSHEQRNRPIATLKESLRNCSQTLYISLLAYHTLYLNLRAKISQRKDQMKAARGTSIRSISGAKRCRNAEAATLPVEPSEEEVQIWYFQVLGFKCPCCEE